MRFDSLPPEFSGLKVDYIQKVNAHEWSSSCPNCGGTVHKNGDPPDRFRMWTNANGKNKIMGWCRSCSYVWFPKNDIPLSKEEFEKWRREQIEAEERKKREAEQAIERLRSEKLWDFYHRELNDWAYEVLNEWGICRENAEFWSLGLIKDYVIYSDEPYHSPAISIPCKGFDGEVKNIKVRALNPKISKDRYRSLYKVGYDVPFVARWDIPSFKTCLVVEGEKKAMVTAATKQNIQVVGVPTKTPSANILKGLDRFENIMICLDPDASTLESSKSKISPLRRMVDILGAERVQVVTLPGKVDDLILKHNLELEDALRYATRGVEWIKKSC